jgi:hypothetical protein
MSAIPPDCSSGTVAINSPDEQYIKSYVFNVVDGSLKLKVDKHFKVGLIHLFCHFTIYILDNIKSKSPEG